MATLLDEKLEALSTITRAGAALDKLKVFLGSADDWDLLRINPLRLAERTGMEDWQAVDLMVCGVRVGLFDLQWTVVCPMCAGIGHTAESIEDLSADSMHCALCDRDTATTLDDWVEVSFTPSPDVRPLNVDPLSSHEAFARFWFTDNVVIPEEVIERVARCTRAFEVLAPGARADLSLAATPGPYRLVSVQLNSLHRIVIADGPEESTEVRVELTKNGFVPSATSAPPGPLTIHVHNGSDETTAIMLTEPDPEVRRILEAEPPPKRPFLTALDLLNTQAFREHFGIQELVPGLRLRVRSLVVLFTDLKDSTALYDRTGDVSAYDFVRDHFEILTECVREHDGAVVKTMGDAVMATFGAPLDAARAAVDMVRRVDELCRRRDTPARLKVGVHEGPALVINADSRLDYFGQTVNTAARVQGMAGGGQVCLTRGVHAAAGVARLFEEHGFSSSNESVSLKGIAEPTDVIRMQSE